MLLHRRHAHGIGTTARRRVRLDGCPRPPRSPRRRAGRPEPRQLHHHIDRGSDLIADVGGRELDIGHHRHRLQPPQQVPARVRVRGGERSVVPRVHRLQHVESLTAPDLTHDDPVGPHAERVAYEVADRDLTSSLDVRRPRFERHDVRPVQAKLGRVFDSDQPFVIGDERRQDPEEGGLAAPGPAAHHHVRPPAHARGEEPHAPRTDAPLTHEVLASERDGRERSDREHRAAERKGRNDRVHPAAARKSRVHPR